MRKPLREGTTMGFYRERILPRIHNSTLDTADLGQIRARVCTSLTGNVVEIGFGSGLNVEHYPPKVAAVHAIEPSGQARRLGQARIAGSPVRVSFDGIDGHRLPLPDQSMDSALVTFSLCSLDDPEVAALELFRVLVPGGFVAYLEHGVSPDPGIANWQSRLNGINRRLSGCRLTTQPPAVLRSAGFTIETSQEYYLPGAPRWAGYLFEGAARKPDNFSTDQNG